MWPQPEPSAQKFAVLGEHVGWTHQDAWGAKQPLASYAICCYFSEALKGLPAPGLF